MWTKLHWVDGPWPGKLASSQHVRAAANGWKMKSLVGSELAVNMVFSLLTDEEERDLDIVKEAAEARAHGMTFLSFSIADRQVPDSEALTGWICC